MKPKQLLVWAAAASLATLSLSAAERDHLRNTRYCEILLVKRHLTSATAAVYNTVGLNDCPSAQWTALSPDVLKRDNNASAVVLNGPRYFVMDRNLLESSIGPVHDFNGLQARLVAQVDLTSASAQRKPYTETTVERETQYVYESGKRIYELVSDQGKTYIMQSYSLEVDPHLNEAALATLAARLSLPQGWRYVVRTLDRDLAVATNGSKVHVLQDDLKNTYQRIETSAN